MTFLLDGEMLSQIIHVVEANGNGVLFLFFVLAEINGAQFGT